MSKILDKAAAKRLIQHPTDNGLHEELQSAYKPPHSTETALVRLQHDVTSSVAGARGVLLALLDLSAAFDTIDESILLKTMNGHLGISGSALTWFSSYMSDRTQRVQTGSDTSDERPFRNDVPQGSVLGPLLFTVYTTPMHDILKRHAVEYYKFADDLKIYIHILLSSCA